MAHKGVRMSGVDYNIVHIPTRHSKPNFKVDIQHCQSFELDTRYSYPPLWALLCFLLFS